MITQPRWGVFGRRYGSFAGTGEAASPTLPTPGATRGGAAVGVGAGFSFSTTDTDEQRKRDVDIAVALLVISQE